MDEEDTITFSQTDSPCISLAALENMRKQGHLCDLTIKVQNHSISAHRVILAASIPYFENVFSTSAVETGETEMVEGLDPHALESLIHFAYTNEIKISMKDAQSVLFASQFLQLDEVRNACVQFLSKRLRVDNVLPLRTFACSLNNVDLFESCNQFIKKNFEEFIKSDDFLTLPYTYIKEIISDDDLNVTGEEVVFEALMKWVKASPEERHVDLHELLCEVRMIYLSVQYVIDRIDSEELILSSKSCRSLVNEVKCYHLLKERRSEFPNLKKRPRNQFNFDLYGICVCDTCGYSLQCFDLAKGVWNFLAFYEKKCEGIGAVVAVNDIIYMFLETTIQTYHMKTCKWDVLNAKHKNISRAAVVSNKNCIYCFGSSNGDYVTKVRCFDTQLNEWVQEGAVNIARHNHAAASLGETIFVTAGQYYKTLSSVEKYSIPTGQWSDVAPLLSGRYNHGCCSMNGRVYVCGGKIDYETMLNSAEVYDPQTELWNFISSTKTPTDCISSSLVSHLNKIYVFTKSNYEEYDPEDDEWKSSPSMPERFRRVVSSRSLVVKTG